MSRAKFWSLTADFWLRALINKKPAADFFRLNQIKNSSEKSSSIRAYSEKSAAKNDFVTSEIAEKIERLQKMLADHGFGGVLLNSQHNFAWLTGGKSNAINTSAENGACFLLVRGDGKSFVLANNIEMPRVVNEEISVEMFEPIEFAWQQEKAAGDFVTGKAQSLLENGENLASDLSLNKEIPAIENLIAACRYQLTNAEIERYRKLGTEAGTAIGSAIKTVSAGETEIEIARKTRNELAKFNINSVVTLVGADERSERFRHPIPTENVWKKILLIAVCAKREGLIVNLSRLVCLGAIPSEMKRKTEAAAFVFAKLWSATKAGKSGAELYQTAADAYAEKGFSDEVNRHHQGGATGYKTRDWVIHPASNERVRQNQAFAWNPSITGTKVEETALIIDDKAEIITSTPDYPQISVAIGGIEYLSSDILSL